MHEEKHSIKVHFKQLEEGVAYEVRGLIVGFKTLVAIFGFSIGAILAGRSLWQYSYDYLGLGNTTLLGVLIFIISARILKKFGS